MPVGLAQDPQVDLDRLDAGALSLPVPQDARTPVLFHDTNAMGGRALHYGQHLLLNTLGLDPADPSPGSDLDQRLPAELANERYGVDGYLRFNQPTTPDDAAWMSAQAHDRRFRDTVLARTRPQPLRDFGASMAGSLLDPVGLPVMLLSDGLGTAALEGMGLARAGETGLAISKLGRLGNLAAEIPGQLAKGAVLNAPYVGLNAALTNYAGEDYDLGDGLRDIAAGAILHTGVHVGGKALKSLLGRSADARAPGEPAPFSVPPAEDGAGDASLAGTPPEAVQALPPESRAGAFAKAIDDMADDRPVDVGQYVQRELEPPSLSRLDERTADPAIASFRPLPDDRGESQAITTRGTEVPVRYGLVELGDLTTSHDDNLSVNPAYPPELQPRDRERAGAQARNYQLETELNPKLLMNDVSAAGGAPIVAPDGTVESGNGRTIALRRSAAKGGEAYERYKAELAAQGFDATGMKAPVLVRMRTEPMEGAQRAALARDMNADVTERMSATEQAMADARGLDDATMASMGEGGAADRRRFARAFLAKVAPDQVNQLVAPDGALSKAGEDRIDAALMAKAYDDPRLVEAMFEAADPNIKAIGGALRQAAPAWAAFRASIARGETPAALDVTEALRSAVDFVRHARDEKIPVGELILERLGQKELFGGEAIGPATEAFLRLFFRDERFTKPLGADKLAGALADYARDAEAYTPGPNLFGDVANVETARQIVSRLAEQFARNDPLDLDLRAPGRAAEPADGGAGGEARPPVIDLREPGGDGDRSGSGVPPEDGGGPEGESGGVQPAKLTGDQLIAADPALKAILEDTDKLAARNGVEIAETPEAETPNTLAEAIRAAAVCLAEEL
ncbi:hypothetical protein [Phenylobacterium sp.]|uniref:hypothetical protein n=1 Tax=Phenylobacterium sp. TaxID=1871053 RepID=UPI002DEAEA77|nr:hypothetical protein [Phenylobacterium sp.]